MASSPFAPADNPVVPCEVRLWQDTSIHVFVHPREWKRVSFGGLCPMIVELNGVAFDSRVSNVGEFYRWGGAKGVSVAAFGLPTHGDYEATAIIDWEKALPDRLKRELLASPELLAAWLDLGTAAILDHLRFIFRARKPEVQDSRLDQVLAGLR